MCHSYLDKCPHMCGKTFSIWFHILSTQWLHQTGTLPLQCVWVCGWRDTWRERMVYLCAWCLQRRRAWRPCRPTSDRPTVASASDWPLPGTSLSGDGTCRERQTGYHTHIRTRKDNWGHQHTQPVSATVKVHGKEHTHTHTVHKIHKSTLAARWNARVSSLLPRLAMNLPLW